MSFFKRKKILVTGGAGFIGSHLCEKILELGADVYSLDNYFTGSKENHLKGVKYFEGHTRDINKIFENENFDLIYHLGEYSRVEKSFEDPIGLVWDLNVAGTFAVLEFCKKINAKIIYSGSSTKFATDGNGGNMSPYAWSKSTNTQLVKNFSDWYKIKYAITYFYNVYGFGEISEGPYATVLGIFKKQYKNGLPLTLVKPGAQKRNFTHVDDVVDALILVGEKGEGDEYGIGSDEIFSVEEVAKMFNTEIIFMPERKGNRSGSEVASEKTKALGWLAKKNIEEHILEWKTSNIKTSSPQNSKEKIKNKVLVYATTFFPYEGLAEKSLFEVTKSIPQIEFHVITTNIGLINQILDLPPNLKIFRIGNGAGLDKLKLIGKGYGIGKKLISENNYAFIWSVMASYGTIPAYILKKRNNIPLLITLGDQKFPKKFSFKYWLLRILISGSDQISTNSVVEENVSRGTNLSWLNSLNKKGDTFANAFRFAYNMIFREKYQNK